MFKLLKRMLKHGTEELYIVECEDDCYIIRTPSSILRKNAIQQGKFSIQEIDDLLKTNIDGNICTNKNVPPFLIGLWIGNINRFEPLPVAKFSKFMSTFEQLSLENKNYQTLSHIAFKLNKAHKEEQSQSNADKQ